MKFNMKVFCVLFFVLINTIGNQGDLNHGLTNVNAVPDSIPPYIVSLRNESYGHMCTGSVISKYWVLSSSTCFTAVYFVYGLRKFENLQKEQKGEYLTTCEERKKSNRSALFKLDKPMGSNLGKLLLPIPSNKEPTSVTVLGWVLDSETKFVAMEEITAKFDEDSIGTNGKLSKLGSGSPLIAGGVIYGFIEACTKGFVKVKDELDWIEEIKNIHNEK